MLRSTAASRSSLQFSESFSTACRWLPLRRQRLRKVDSRICAWNRRRARTSRNVVPRSAGSWPRHVPLEKHLQRELAGFAAQRHANGAARAAGAFDTSRWMAAPGFFGNLAHQLRHFDRGEARLVTLIAAFQSGAIDRLFERVACEDAKNHRHAGIELRQLNAARGFRHDVHRSAKSRRAERSRCK